MEKYIVFIQVHGQPGILEAEVSDAATLAEIHAALAALGIKIDAETLIFIDEAEQHEQGEPHQRVGRLKPGCRIHVSGCKHIKTTVHFAHHTAGRDFAPGTRVRKVKEWAVREFRMDPKDAAEHVLQLCNSTDRPSTDTPLHQLVQGHDCRLCFDLVPDKRVEGHHDGRDRA
jgi:hypothetical protein